MGAKKPPLVERCARCGEPIRDGACPACGPDATPVRSDGFALMGIFDLVRGAFFLLTRPGLWPYMIVPLLANFGVWVWLYFQTRDLFEAHAQPWLAERIGEGWWLAVAEKSTLVAFVLLAVMLFSTCGSLLNAPFYDFLSEATEKRYLGGLPPSGGLRGLARRSVRAFLAALKAALWIVLWYVLWLPLLLVPVVGQIGYFLAMARLRTLEVQVFTFARKEYRLREMRAFLRANYLRSFGLGGVLNLCLAVPIIGWLAYPVAVVGGTLAYLDGKK